MKGIVLAGGSGTRLYPMTIAICKQLLPVYDKPMIYYPLSVLMETGVRDVLIISTPSDLPHLRKLLGDGKSFGIKLHYTEQASPDGLAQAFLLGRSFIGNDACVMVLGDNLFFGRGFPGRLRRAAACAEGGRAGIFAKRVSAPESFGVVEIGVNGEALSIEEKPVKPKSEYAVTGLYFYPPGVAATAEEIGPSPRGELEITSLNEIYRRQGLLDVYRLCDDFCWMDLGTPDSLAAAADYVRRKEKRGGILISSPEVIAFQNSWIDRSVLLRAAGKFGKTDYGRTLLRMAERKDNDAIR